MYHFELRKFPHSVARFNQSERQLLAIVLPWTSAQWVELGERKWNVNESKLTVLEGPELSMPELSMNRGWRNAQRRSEDVTERVLAAARAQAQQRAGAAPAPAPAGAGGAAVGMAQVGGGAAAPSEPAGAAAEAGLTADSLALEALALLDRGPLAPARVWALAQQRDPTRSPAESLALAERALRSLIARQLVELRRAPAGARSAAEAGEALRADAIEEALHDVASWVAGGDDTLAIARRA